jgi:hypothetical protein
MKSLTHFLLFVSIILMFLGIAGGAVTTDTYWASFFAELHIFVSYFVGLLGFVVALEKE